MKLRLAALALALTSTFAHAALIPLTGGIDTSTYAEQTIEVFVGGPYTIDVDWTFNGDGATQTASWGAVAAISASHVPIPEPGTLALLGLGLGLLGLRRFNKRCSAD